MKAEKTPMVSAQHAVALCGGADIVAEVGAGGSSSQLAPRVLRQPHRSCWCVRHFGGALARLSASFAAAAARWAAAVASSAMLPVATTVVSAGLVA